MHKKSLVALGLAAVVSLSILIPSFADQQDSNPQDNKNKKPKDPIITKHVIKVDKSLNVPYDSKNKALFPDGLPIGLGSGMTIKSLKKNGDLELYFLTDRGPNADGPKYKDEAQEAKTILFPTPHFTPQIGTATVTKNGVIVNETITLKDAKGQDISGLPMEPGSVGSTNEVALSKNLEKLPFDKNGQDPEAIAVDKDGNFWIADEYGPFITQFDSNGKQLKKYMPGDGLPSTLKYRQPNRGFEALSITPNGKVYASVQSTLDIKGKTKNTASFIQIVELDPQTGKTKLFAYPHDVKAYKNSRDAKIGDMFAISNSKFVLIEQGKTKDKKMRNLLYLIDLKGATDISEMKVDGRELEYSDNLSKLKKFKPIKKKKIIDLRKHGWEAEKAEGLAVLPDKQTIFVLNDNDFGVSLDVKDDQVEKPDIEDYTLHADGTLTYKGQSADPTLTVVPNNEKTHLFSIKLPKPLK
ncbi:hypothetical protein JOD24_003210 [Kroppenstedtia sanguinis]|uniref:Esterase-like activity of phytase family protein n=1 Tax=Kroppenstedtia sanguinis TaxID=1380684 RepID=A0ABW4CC43_9BACL